MENFYNNLDDLINYIKNTIEYKKCLELKNKMSSNTNINKLMNDIRDLQKKYIRSNYDENIKLELDKVNEELMEENLALRESFRQFKEKEINIKTFKE